MNSQRHYWVQAISRRDRAKVTAGLATPPILAAADAHRRLRGPYTAAGTLLRAVVPAALEQWPELVARHSSEILAAAPELGRVLPPRPETLMSQVSLEERTQFFPRVRTLAIAHSLAEFLRDFVLALDEGARTLFIDNAHEADPTDGELLAVMLRRFDPAVVTVVVGTSTQDVPEAPLTSALRAYADLVEGREPAPALPEADLGELAQAYVATDGTSDEPAQIEAYHLSPANERAALHDARADALVDLDEPSLGLGAIPYHRERGTDPTGEGVNVLSAAATYCVAMGYYHAALDLAQRGKVISKRAERRAEWEEFAARTATSLVALGRIDEVEPLLDEMSSPDASPRTQIRANFAAAMTYTSHREAHQRDHGAGRASMTEAMNVASRLADQAERELVQAQNCGGLALVEFNDGNPDESLRLLDDGLAALAQLPLDGAYALQALTMRIQRAVIHAHFGRHDLALADLAAAIEMDPNDSRIYLERAGLLHKLGRITDAMEDYKQAVLLSPPYPEIYYNRGDAELELGDSKGALVDLSYVIELDPSHVDAYVNRAGLLCDLGRLDQAWGDIEAGLALAPADAHLLCLKGRLLAETDQVPAARDALSAAVQANPDFAEAWATRGALAYEAGDLASALTDLDNALRLEENSTVRFNRAVARQEEGREAEAIEDYNLVLAASEDPDARYQRGVCNLRLGRQESAREDFLTCLATSPAHAGQVQEHMPDLAPQ